MIKGLIIGDLHFGHNETKRMYDELSIFKTALNNPDLDIAIFNGDYFDHKLTFDEPDAFYAILFFNEVINICKKNKIAIRMIQGTKSHDLNQLQMFKAQEKDIDLNFKIVETASTECFNGMNICYIPEEYPTDAAEFYKELKAEDKEYNLICSHATWDTLKNGTGLGLLLAKLGTSRAPVFIEKEWIHTLKNGICVSGHIHEQDFSASGKIIYPGSFSRWGFGEVSPRGFLSFTFDDTKTVDSMSYEFIENTLAPNYNSYEINDILTEGAEITAPNVQVAIDKLIENNNDLVRVDISGLNKGIIDIIKKYYATSDRIKITTNIDKKKTTALKENKDVVSKDAMKKYEYIIKRQLNINDMVQRFCKEEYGLDIPIEVINGLLGKEGE